MITINQKPLSTWGARLMDGAVESLLTPAPAKEYIQSKSRLQHGIRVAAASENARTDSREVSIPILIEGRNRTEYFSRYLSFVEELKGGNIALAIPDLGFTFRLVYLSCGKYGSYGDCRAKLTVKFLEPNPEDRQ